MWRPGAARLGLHPGTLPAVNPSSRPHLRLLVVGAAALALVATACSSGGSDAKGSGSTSSTSAPEKSAAVDRTGPTAKLTEITGPGKVFIGSATPTDLGAVGYEEHEYVASGTATSYRPEGELGSDGKWSLTPDTTAPYRTRVLVRRPADKTKSSGNVVVEWLNVSGGVDADPDWASLNEEIVRRGDTWVGVSAQLIGVEGGPVLVSVAAPGVGDVAGKGLKKIDPARYGSLDHPGDGYSFDIFTQAARAARAGGDVTGGAKVRRVTAAGESQSAFALVSYVNGVQPLTHAFDAFFVHSRGAVGLGFVGPGQAADIAGSISGTATTFRTDGTEPVMDLQSESDVVGVLNSVAARQPDSDTFRLWEVAGTAHADRHLMGSIADSLDCGVPVNDGPLHVVAKAAYRALGQWVSTGTPPRSAPRLALTAGGAPAVARDADGIALEGVRTPPLDVPIEVLSGVPGSNPAVICILLGSTTPLPADRIAALYPTRADYERKYRAAVAAAIAKGYVLPQDRAAILAYSHPDRVTG